MSTIHYFATSSGRYLTEAIQKHNVHGHQMRKLNRTRSVVTSIVAHLSTLGYKDSAQLVHWCSGKIYRHTVL
jgi:hypothetical protein